MARDAERDRLVGRERIPSIVAGLGAVFGALYVVELFVFYRGFEVGLGEFLVGLFVSGIFVVVLVVIGYWLAGSDLPSERYPRIGVWTLSGLVFFLGINLPMIDLWAGGSLAARISWARWAATVGAATGAVIGCVEARAIQRELAAQRATVRAETVEDQRRWLDYLNGLLRHEVLNTANVITGYASLLLRRDDLDDDAKPHLETIHRQGREMTNVIKDVRVLIETTQGEVELEPKDLADVLTAELDKLSSTYGSVTVESSVPDGLCVVGDDLLPRLFSNLFRNAVEHNDGDHPRVEVTAERTDGAVRVRVADNGPGIPSDEIPTLFERSDNTGASHGLGLYLVSSLAERYGGSVELSETGEDGSVFAVELPTAEPDDPGGTDRAIAAGN